MNPLREKMPAMLRHEGVWTGIYRHLDRDGGLVDQHQSRVECVFPDSGPVVYIQRNLFTWPDGRVLEYEFGGTLEGDRIYWDTDRFRGYSWCTRDDLILLNLERKDEPGAMFYEVIMLGSDPNQRSRTWHWFRDGALYKRTLCDEIRNA